jgi:hypothetical protein
MVACNEGTRAHIWEQPLNEREQKFIEKIYKFIGSMVWRYTPRQFRKNEIIVSESWMRAYKASMRAAKKYKGLCKEETFAYLPIKDALRSFWLMQKRQLYFDNGVGAFSQGAVFDSEEIADELPATKPSHEDHVLRSDYIEFLLSRLKKHNARWHESVALKLGFPCGDHECKERRSCDVAELIDCSPQLVRARVIAGLAYLRSISEEE